MRPMSSIATFVLAALVATSAAKAAGGATTLPAPQAVESADQPVADPTPREIVNFTGPQTPGTVIINTSERRLYFVLPGQQAVEYAVGVGRPGFEWAGVEHIANKRAWPDWTPPSEMLKRCPDLPRHMAGGIDNPLGARAMYLSGTLYRIHGSNEADTIGQAGSSGCIRMTNDDVVDLYDRASWRNCIVLREQRDGVAPRRRPSCFGCLDAPRKRNASAAAPFQPILMTKPQYAPSKP